MRHPVPRFASGGLVLSYTCSASCAHCMYACTPKWKSGWISEGTLDALLRQLAHTIVPAPGGPDTIGLSHGLHFTGGEPFLKFDLLARAVGKAHALGIPSLFVETNGFGARKDDETRDKLEHLKAAGLRGIMISVPAATSARISGAIWCARVTIRNCDRGSFTSTWGERTP